MNEVHEAPQIKKAFPMSKISVMMSLVCGFTLHMVTG